MAKLTRSALKEVVKECLVEILSEGIAGNNKSLMAERKNLNSRSMHVKNKKASALDHMKINKKNESLLEAVAGNNDIMQDIFRDTLENTITAQSQAAEKSTIAQRAIHGDAATKKMVGSDPMDMFEGANNWATLAFSSEDKL